VFSPLQLQHFGGWSGVLVIWSLPHLTRFGWYLQCADECSNSWHANHWDGLEVL
jgi:hypothetical protein